MLLHFSPAAEPCHLRYDHLSISLSMKFLNASLLMSQDMRSISLGCPLRRSLTPICDAENSPFPAISPPTPNPPTACPSVISRGPAWCPPCFLLVIRGSACVDCLLLGSGCSDGPARGSRRFAANRHRRGASSWYRFTVSDSLRTLCTVIP